MFNFVAFNPSGKIIQKGTVQDEECVIVPENCGYIEYDNQHAVDFNMDYFDGMTVRRRPEFPAEITSLNAVIGDEVVISSIPSPTTMTIEGSEHVITDGSVTLISDVPAKYSISVDQWPYLPWSVEIQFTE